METGGEAKGAGATAKEAGSGAKEAEGRVSVEGKKVREGAAGTNEEERRNREDRTDKEDRAGEEWGKASKGRGGRDEGRTAGDKGRTRSAEEWDGAGEAITWTEWVNMIGRRSLAEITDLFEGKLLLHLLGSGRNRTEMADLLGISRQALYKKLQKYHPGK